MELGKILEPILKSNEPAIEKIEALPKNQRILIFCGVFVVLIGAFVYFSFLPKYKTIDRLEAQYQQLEAELAAVKKDAQRREKFLKKYAEAQKQFKKVMRQLPEKKEIPNLLASISSSGQDSGLEFALFEPKPENKKDFYAEIPVSVKVSGSYHNVAMFFDKVSRLSRIVNIDNISITAQKGTKKGLSLTTSCTAVTYRFIEKKSK